MHSCRQKCFAVDWVSLENGCENDYVLVRSAIGLRSVPNSGLLNAASAAAAANSQWIVTFSWPSDLAYWVTNSLSKRKF